MGFQSCWRPRCVGSECRRQPRFWMWCKCVRQEELCAQSQSRWMVCKWPSLFSVQIQSPVNSLCILLFRLKGVYFYQHPVILSKHDDGRGRKAVAMAAEMMKSRCKMHDIPCLVCNYFTSQCVIVAIRVHFSIHNAYYVVDRKIKTLKQCLPKPWIKNKELDA